MNNNMDHPRVVTHLGTMFGARILTNSAWHWCS